MDFNTAVSTNVYFDEQSRLWAAQYYQDGQWVEVGEYKSREIAEHYAMTGYLVAVKSFLESQPTTRTRNLD